jgi:AcrR family transcriptional regulator
MSTKDKIRAAGLKLFVAKGYDATSVAQICEQAGVSNGSFFHAHKSKELLAADIYVLALQKYHASILAVVAEQPNARDGIEGLIRAHVDWVVSNKVDANFLFEQTRSDWMNLARIQQAEENARFGKKLSLWLEACAEEGTLVDMPTEVVFSQLIGPIQMNCRAWLSGRSKKKPIVFVDVFIAAAQRALLDVN